MASKARPMSKAKLEAQQATEHLRGLLPPGTTVHTVLRHVARSGMQRRIDVYLLRDQEEVYLTGYVSKAIGYRRHKEGGLVVSGCGMDMGFAVVHELAQVLYPEGFECVGFPEQDDGTPRSRRCPSNDHSNGDRSYEPHHHKYGGYALRQEWI